MLASNREKVINLTVSFRRHVWRSGKDLNVTGSLPNLATRHAQCAVGQYPE